MSDLISRQAAIDAIEEVDWYHQNKNKDMVSGANSFEHQAWYKADDIYKTLGVLPSAEAIPVEWIENYITMLTVGGHSDHEPELEEENEKKAQAIRGMLEYYKLDKRISNLEEEINKIKCVVKKFY